MVVHQIESKEQLEAAIEKYKVVVIECYVELSVICRLMAAFNRRMSREHPKAYYVNFDVDKIPEIRQSLRIRTTPSFIIFKDGKRVGQLVGFNPRGLEIAVSAALIGIEKPSSNLLYPKYSPTKAPTNAKVAMSNYLPPKSTAIQI